MNTSEVTIRMIFSARVRPFIQVETWLTPRDRRVPNRRTGSPVPIAKIGGNATPPVDLSAIGIKAPKKRTAL